MRSLPTRRAVLGASAALAGSGLLSACSDAGTGPATGQGSTGHGAMRHGGSAADTPPGYVDPAGPEVRAAEAARKATGPLAEVKVTATATPLDLGGGVSVRSWAYGDTLPGKEVRATAGGTLALTLANNLPEATSLHWHGLALRNDMDGVPGLTQRDIAPGGSFSYEFAVPTPGTFWFHPHTGVQQDRGLYAPLIIEDPKEPLSYDKEWVVVLDDWLDGVDGSTPDAVLASLRKGMAANHAAHGPQAGKTAKPGTPGTTGATRSGGPDRLLMGSESDILGKEAGDVAYPHYLINGRVPADPSVFTAKPGDRIRLRIVNAGGDTAFRIALGGHQLTVTHTDGFPVEPATTDCLLLGMGERYDVLVTAGDGVFPLTALAEGKGQAALAVLRTGAGTAPTASTRPAELESRPLPADELKAAESVALDGREPDRTLQMRLTGNMQRYNWAFDNEPYTPEQRRPVKAGERVRIEFANSTPMWHPLHLHGHTFALGTGGQGGARKDTTIILPGQRLTVEFDADNPGLWMAHCHNVYHSESGMMTVLGYQL
ncbi:multicopper oxidase domain-containing protein [Streptomyces goshikiensis]|uniref:multicopper oxidase family protein n=1 Tax=Streptomyces goshikiensis TaxID=1942 RepID=UPI0022F4029D|nr:multicopper oxidase domain-containing protein [Streptomyces goshikiensis]WBY19944.1 multicopper oxidase domain-containing protein [Streptomyces goshikiensis]WSR98731.1 multicopper oxidase domain-containing protein [Streptomyces goshikiensis]WSY00236.1 multicopper oxidase domain-containing protein [Streptomyces goshikiensis]